MIRFRVTNHGALAEIHHLDRSERVHIGDLERRGNSYIVHFGPEGPAQFPFNFAKYSYRCHTKREVRACIRDFLDAQRAHEAEANRLATPAA